MASDIKKVKPKCVMDLEIYPNYFLCSFMRLEDDFILALERTEEKELDVRQIQQILRKYEVITFNGNKFDIPMLKLAMTGVDNAMLKAASDSIIHSDRSSWEWERERNLPDLRMDHVDLIELSPGIDSLKTYMGRLHCKKLQDLPIPPNKRLTVEEMTIIRDYCGNDLRGTKALFLALEDQVNLRRAMSDEYGIDLRSKSDPQIAEAVISTEITRSTKKKPQRPPIVAKEFLYLKPDFIKFKNPKFNHALEVMTKNPFSVSSSGIISMPKEVLSLKIPMGCSVYQMGMGGLHSSESKTHYIADEEFLVCDWDVTSYYPMIILICRLFPNHIGPIFLEIFKKIVDERIDAKEKGKGPGEPIQIKIYQTKDGSLKIVINGSFGKLGSPYSIIYAPELMVQVTVTGQLALLMLIEELESVGISIVSANTDGIVMKCPVGKEELMKEKIRNWEETTGFTMERSDYSAIYSRDVNNYIAITTKGKVKTKGCFAPGTLKKNPSNEICNLAVIEYLKHGTPIQETVTECDDITKFLTLRKVNGGAVKGTKEIGKTVRWYYSKGERGTINYKTNGNQVPRSFGAKPLMDLPDVFPFDIDYLWYMRECEDLLTDIGMGTKGQMPLF